MYTRIGDKGYWVRQERLFANLSLILCGFLIGVVFSAFVFSGAIAGITASIAAFFLPALIYWAGMRFWLQERFKYGASGEEVLPVKLLKPNI